MRFESCADEEKKMDEADLQKQAWFWNEVCGLVPVPVINLFNLVLWFRSD